MTHVFIVNPFAGGGKSLKILNKDKRSMHIKKI